jgi:hypothetical protein
MTFSGARILCGAEAWRDLPRRSTALLVECEFQNRSDRRRLTSLGRLGAPRCVQTAVPSGFWHGFGVIAVGRAAHGEAEVDHATHGKQGKQYGEIEMAARRLSARSQLNRRGTPMLCCQWPASLAARQDA